MVQLDAVYALLSANLPVTLDLWLKAVPTKSEGSGHNTGITLLV